MVGYGTSNEVMPFYKFDFCARCPFYECELVEEYTQFRENHVQINESQVPTVTIRLASDREKQDDHLKAYSIGTALSDIDIL